MIDRVELPGCGEPNKAGCIELISRYGTYQLGGGGGCGCSYFSVCGFEIDVSCHKSEHCVRVYSHHLFSQHEDLVEIAAVVVGQLGESGDGYRVRFCDYSHDHKNGRWENGVWMQEYSCCYCSNPRTDEDGYLCTDCLGNKDAVSAYPFGLERLARSCPKCESKRIERDFLGLSEMKKEPILFAGREIGSSTVGALPKQEGESIFRCLACGHHWREKKAPK